MNKQLLCACLLLMAAYMSAPGQKTNVVQQSSEQVLLSKFSLEKNSDKSVPNDWLSKAQSYIEKSEYFFNQSQDRSDIFFTANRQQRTGFSINNAGFTASLVHLTDNMKKEDLWNAGLQLQYIGKGSGNIFDQSKNDYSFRAAQENLSIDYKNFSIEYLNNKTGLRQNFIINKRPAGEKDLEIIMDVTGNLNPFTKNNILQFKNNKGVTKLFYRDLKVWDSNHQALPAEMKLKEGKVSIMVNDANAVYPITVDPLNQTPDWTTSATGLLPTLIGQLAVDAAYGFSVAGLGDVNGDGFADVGVGAPATADVITGSGSIAAVGAVFVYFGSASGLPTIPSAKLQPTTLVAGSLFGFSLAGGDISGDGKNDIIVGAPMDRVTINIGGNNTASGTVGKAYVFNGATLATNTSPLLVVQLSGNGILRNGINLSVKALFGFSVAVTEDFNGDNKKDIIIGAPTYAGIKAGLLGLGDVVDVQSGGAFVYLTASNLSNISQVKLEPIKQDLLGLGLLTSNINGLLFGYAVDGLGDYNGDGRSDVVATAPAGVLISGKLLQGSAVVYYGTANGVNADPGAILTATSGGLITNLIGTIANVANLFGVSVRGVKSAAGIRNGNILVGAPLGGTLINVLGLDLKTGTVNLFKKKGSSPSGNVAPDQVLSSPRNSNNILQLIQANLLFGYSLDNAHDVNCDGYGDIIVGEPISSGVQLLNANVTGGAAYVYLGTASGSYQAAPIWTLTVVEDAFLGINGTSLVGYSVAGAGKVKGNPYNDCVLVGSPSRTLDFGAGLLNLGPTLGTLFSLVAGNNGVGKAYLFDLKVCDHSPIAVNDVITTNEDTSVSDSASTNDSPSLDGGNTWTLVGPNGGAAHGTVTMNPDGIYTYTPAPDYNGPDVFTYQVCDIDGDCSTATVTVTVIPVDDLPVAVNDVNTTNEDTPVSGNASANDTPSADGGNVWSLNGTNGGALHGTVTMNANGTYTYTPAANYNGSDVFSYKLCDVDGDCSNATVTITIAPVDDLPVAVNDVNSTDEDTPVSGNASTNDTPSGDGGNIWSLVGTNGGAAHGTVTMNANGTYTYTPAANYNGSDVFTYTLCDADNDCSTATVTITINAVDDTPTAVNDVATTNEDTPVSGNAASNDTPSGDCVPNIWSLVGTNGGALHGTVTMNANGTYTYTPAANYNGSDVFTYRLCDCDATPDCSTATVTVTITPVDDMPTAVNDVATTNEDTPVSGNAASNDIPSGDCTPNIWSLVGTNGGALHGTVTMNANGTYTYTPAANYNGSDVFTYKVCDCDATPDCSTATVTITINAVDDMPTAVNDVATTNEDTPVSGNAASNDTPSGDCTPNIWSLVGTNGGALHGTVTMNANGTYTYTPAANYNGSDVFTYRLCDCDASPDCSTATVTVTITPVDDLPVAVNDVNTTNEDTPVSGNAASNDTPSADGGNVWSLVGANGGAAHGTVTMNANGTYTYTPAANYNGSDVFTYTLCDADNDCSTATVTITINAVDDTPIAVNDVATTNEDTPVSGNAASNDAPSGDCTPNIWSLVGTNGGALHGTVTMNANGTYTYTPAANYNGSDVFTYRLCDCDASPDCSTATVTITINAVDDMPTAVNDVATTNEDTPVSGNAASNDTPSGDCTPNIWSLVGTNGGALHGTVTMNANGTYTYTPAANYNGSDVFTYRLCDCDASPDCSTATVTITINAVDDMPTAVNDVATTNEDTPVSGNAASNDTPSGDCTPNIWSLVGTNGGALHGTVTMNANGTYTYTPAANYNGSDVFTYRLCDCDATPDCSTATVTITINAVDDMPAAVNDVATTNEDTPVSGNAASNDTPSGDCTNNTWSLVGPNGGASHGTVTMNTNGTYTYTPTPNYFGNDVFTYQLCDCDGDCSTATVTITVNPVDDLPLAVNDVNSTNQNTAVNGNASTNDTPSGDGGNVWSLVGANGGAAHGTVTMNVNGTYTYTPAAGYSGSDVFTYKLCDADVDCSNATVTITISSVCNMTLSAIVTNATCPGVSNGAIDVTVNGANGNITYLWNDGATTQDRTGLAAGSYSVTATDALGCTVSSGTYNVTATDAIPPTIICPSNKTLVLGASCSASLPDYRSLATVNDNCTAAANIIIVQSPAAGTILNGTGSTTVTLTATDASGNSSNCSFTVTRVDQTAPSITCPTNKALVLGSTCSVTLPDYRSQATVSDNCTAAANITIVQSPAAGTVLNGVGSTTVTLTATDASGNSANCSFTVTRVDQTAPVLSCQAPKTIGCGMTLTFNAPTATDNCGGITTNVISTTSTDIGNAIVYTRTWQAVDGSGNLSATCSQSVTQNKCSAHIFPTSTTCASYKSGAEPLAQLCYATSGQSVSNVTPGVFFYFTYITAPSSSFVIDVVQTNGCGFKMFSIQQGKQITLFNNSCGSVVSGTEISLGQGRINVTNAVAGAQYVLVVKYDSKSVQGSTFTGSAPVCQYNFETKINGTTADNTQGSINMVPNCNAAIVTTPQKSETPAKAITGSSETMQATIFPNPSEDYFKLRVTTESNEIINVRVVDISGRIVKQMRVTALQFLQFGDELKNGMYMVEVRQGTKRVILKIEKL